MRMKQKKLTKKLNLNKTTIASLNGKEMHAAAGGTAYTDTILDPNCVNISNEVCNNSCYSHCPTFCDTCPIWFSDCCPC